MKSTIAAVCRNKCEMFGFEDVELSSLQKDEVRVEVCASGICHIDLAGRELVPLPAIFGHEGAGIIKEVGSSVSQFKIGDKVVMSYAWCGNCVACINHEPYHCAETWDITFSGKRADGTSTVTQGGKHISAAFFQQSSFAFQSICSQRNLVKVDQDIDFNILAALPCGILTGVGIIKEQFSLSASDSVIIFGAGAVGLAAVMAAKVLKVKTIALVDINVERLKKGSNLGATVVIDANQCDVVKEVEKLFPHGFPFSIETTGNATVFNQAIEVLSTGGRMAACIIPSPMEDFQFKPFQLFIKAASLESVSFGNAVAQKLIPTMIDWFLAGEFPVDEIITQYDFNQINQACADINSGKAIKPVLCMNQIND